MNLQFIENLGQGGFGKVDLVCDSSNNQIYAQKSSTHNKHNCMIIIEKDL